jgi:hypothetical protein
MLTKPVLAVYDVEEDTPMKWFFQYYIDALILSAVYTGTAMRQESPLAMQSYAELLSAVVMVVFVQFLFQATPPPGYRVYLRLAYGTLLLFSGVLVANGPLWGQVFLSGYLFFVTIIFLLRQLRA